ALGRRVVVGRARNRADVRVAVAQAACAQRRRRYRDAYRWLRAGCPGAPHRRRALRTAERAGLGSRRSAPATRGSRGSDCAVARPPLAEFAGAEWADLEATRLEALHLQALQLRLDTLLCLGRHAEALPDLERLVGDYPLDERFWAQLMLAYYRAGRQA